jgi:predicted transcriptional regulator
MSYQQVILRQTLEGEPVRRFMNDHPVTVPPSATLKDLVENYFYRHNFKMFPVADDGHLLGCITLNQVKAIPREEWEGRTAQSIAMPCSGENTIPPEADAVKALSAMNRTHASRLMVVDHERLVGVISLKDLLNFLSRKIELEGAT